jgi:GDPmannose 4,6-dehydratase
MFASSGILYNHESPRRGYEFVTRKITSSAARIKLGKAKELRLGNLDASRDWGHAKDSVQAMWMMMQKDQPDDYVIATGISHTVREFAETAFSLVGLNYADYVVVDPRFYRPTEVDILVGDSSKARKELVWTQQYSFKSLVEEMVMEDMKIEQSRRD